MYIINTDNGYIVGGELHNGLRFGMKEDARVYSEGEIDLYGELMMKDLHTYYCCNDVELENI